MKKSPASTLALVGAVLHVAIPVGFVVTIWRLGNAISGMEFADTEDVSVVMASLQGVTGGMGRAFDSVLIGMAIALVGAMLFTVALTRYRFRRPWAFWFACVGGCVFTLLIPFWLPVWVFLLIYALMHRREFLPGGGAELSHQG